MDYIQQHSHSLKLNQLIKSEKVDKQLHPTLMTKVYYKRPGSQEWRVSDSVIGQDGSVIFITQRIGECLSANNKKKFV